MEKFFETTAFGVPASSGDSGKVAEGSTITVLGSMTRRSGGGTSLIRWRKHLTIFLHITMLLIIRS
ncbi:hypothetical protein [Sphingobacterium olei]|uniref:hypothetical protein n=1 Tax=Sphingobacterium olei TaxID=2571155 RepID=UPI001EE48C36|nr:hypothetical protein [Sphingobacterium olei]